MVKNFIKNIPFLRQIAQAIYYGAITPLQSFPSSSEYWKRRYKSGGSSGTGSYDKLAQFKAEIVNSFVKDKQISTVIEFGCGDGNQLRLANYPSYLGFDVSKNAILRCKNTFTNDTTKEFKLLDNYTDETAELSMSLDVIYHLVENHIFSSHMEQLFESSSRYVIVYSSDTDDQESFQAPHVKHRKFTKWIETYKPMWKLVRHIPNRHPYTGNNQEGSLADFYIYTKSTTK